MLARDGGAEEIVLLAQALLPAFEEIASALKAVLGRVVKSA